MSKPLTYREIEAYLYEVADVLGGDGESRIVVVVGGALLAYYQIRNTTTDVDSARLIDQDLAAAILEVAKRHGLDEDWLNPRGFPHRPLTLDENECEVMLEHGRLKVLAAPVDQVFLMKLIATAPGIKWTLCSLGRRQSSDQQRRFSTRLPPPTRQDSRKMNTSTTSACWRR